MTALVTVSCDDVGWTAVCHECRSVVGVKDSEDDAHLAAARHLARVHG